VSLFYRGLLIGFAIAAPVGAIGVLCIRRTLAHGRAIGLATGLGAASADAVYGAIAAFGLTAVTSFLTGQAAWLRIVGGIILLWLGWRTFRSQPAECTADDSARIWPAYATTFALTLTNPSTIISFAAVFAGLGLAGTRETGSAEAGWLVLGVFSGSAAWWLLLSGVVGALRERVDARAMRWVNRASGAIVAGLGVTALATGVRLLG
jgi:threonine/homoserine/homoserine lactone efflux protein